MIFEKVDELCELIEETKQYNDYLEAEVELENDGHGIDLIKDFNDLQQEYINVYNEGKQDEVVSMQNILESRHTELLAYPTTGAYIRAKRALVVLLTGLNTSILRSLGLTSNSEGCDSCSSDSCEDGCCGGCH